LRILTAAMSCWQRTNISVGSDVLLMPLCNPLHHTTLIITSNLLLQTCQLLTLRMPSVYIDPPRQFRSDHRLHTHQHRAMPSAFIAFIPHTKVGVLKVCSSTHETIKKPKLKNMY
jgi:hypothetical protein